MRLDVLTKVFVERELRIKELRDRIKEMEDEERDRSG